MSSQTQYIWRKTFISHQTYHIIRNSINNLIQLIRHTDWEIDNRSRIEIQRALYSLKKSLNQESDLDTYLDIRADCKMRKVVDYRLNIILEIFERTNKQRTDIVELDNLLDQLEKIKTQNLDLLEESERLTQEWKNKKELDKNFAKNPYLTQNILTKQNIIGKRRRQLDKIEAHKERTNHRMIVFLTQHLLGNAYEFTDEYGNKIFKYALSKLSPTYYDILKDILNRNYRDATSDEIKINAHKAINLVIKGFNRVKWNIPDYIEEQIQELKEALSDI